MGLKSRIDEHVDNSPNDRNGFHYLRIGKVLLLRRLKRRGVVFASFLSFLFLLFYFGKLQIMHKSFQLSLIRNKYLYEYGKSRGQNYFTPHQEQQKLRLVKITKGPCEGIPPK